MACLFVIGSEATVPIWIKFGKYTVRDTGKDIGPYLSHHFSRDINSRILRERSRVQPARRIKCGKAMSCPGRHDGLGRANKPDFSSLYQL